MPRNELLIVLVSHFIAKKWKPTMRHFQENLKKTLQWITTRKIRNSFLLKSLLFWFFRFVFQWLPLVLLFFFGFLGFSAFLFHWKILVFDLRRNEFLIIFKNKKQPKTNTKANHEKNPKNKSKEKQTTNFAMKNNTKPIRRCFFTNSWLALCCIAWLLLAHKENPPEWLCVAFHCKTCFFWFSLDFHRVFSWLALVFLLFFRFFRFWFHSAFYFIEKFWFLIWEEMNFW